MWLLWPAAGYYSESRSDGSRGRALRTATTGIWNTEYKRSCHEGCIGIPLIIHGPGFESGKSPVALISLIDLPPTVLTAAGVRPPDTMRGRPLRELLRRGGSDLPDEDFLQIRESHCGRAIRTRKWKYSVRAPDRSGLDPSSEIYVEDFLYDLEIDPHERNNLVCDPILGRIREQLSRTLKRRIAEAGKAEPQIPSKA